jgi:antitoxin VapB
MEIAKVFWTGRSQAVRLPKSFCFDAKEVSIRRHGDAVILEPVAPDWHWLEQVVGAVDADFEAAVAEQPAGQERPAPDEPA